MNLMANVLIALFSLWTGWASAYDPGVFQDVMRNHEAGRTEWQPQVYPSFDGYTAFPLEEYMGQVIEARSLGCSDWKRLWVVDTANPADGGLTYMAYDNPYPITAANAARMRERMRSSELKPRIPIEVDYETYREWKYECGTTRVEVRFKPLSQSEQQGRRSVPRSMLLHWRR